MTVFNGFLAVFGRLSRFQNPLMGPMGMYATAGLLFSWTNGLFMHIVMQIPKQTYFQPF